MVIVDISETSKPHLYWDYHADDDITERDTGSLAMGTGGGLGGVSPGRQDIGFPPSPSIFWTLTESRELEGRYSTNKSINSIWLEP